MAAAVGLGACSDPSFSVDGTVEGAGGKTLVLERPDAAGAWVAVDSTRLSDSGKFRFTRHAPAAPEIYRLVLDGNYVYFPVDSVETVTVKAPASHFATDFELSGSPDAEKLARFEKTLIAASPILTHPDSARAFKRRVYTEFLQEGRGSVVSYYILTKTVGGEPLFSPEEDGKYFAAVATALRSFRPDDPRLPILEQTAREARRQANAAAGRQHVLQAEEISLFDIELPGTDGRPVKLSSVAGKGTPVILLFSDLTDPETIALNEELRGITGARIYNVGVDEDQLLWRNAARNLPWTCVYASTSDLADIAMKYNVPEVPAIFVIDASGNLKARCGSIDEVRRNI